MQIIVPSPIQCQVQQHGTFVLLLKNGTLLLEMPWEAAVEIGRALIQMGRKAEEQAKADRVAFDQAILLRSGADIRLTADAYLYREAHKIAEHDSQLRKYLPMTVENQVKLGTPVIKSEKREE